jgi:hypothetical protein
MMIATHRICTAVKGSGRPSSGGGQLEAHELHDVVVKRATLPHRTHQRREIVIKQDHGGGGLGNRRAAAHGDADVGAFQGRRVVHAVTGHGHHMAFFLQRAHDLDLVAGRDAGEHCKLVDGGGQLIGIQAVQLGARHGRALESEFSRDGRRGERVVAGDHLDGNACRPALGNGHPGLGAGRVHQPDQTDEAEFMDPGNEIA